MKKRYDKDGETLKLIPAQCKGYRVGTTVEFADNHQQIVMVDKFHLDWPQCNACYKEAYKLFSQKTFNALSSIKKPKAVRDANTISKWLGEQLTARIDDPEAVRILGEMHVAITDKCLALLEKYYAG